MSTKTYKKFTTLVATSALVASAIVPVAAATPQEEVADTSYTDVPVTSDHYENIMKARELGIMTGYPNGTFQPNKLLNRGDVTKALGKFVVAQSGLTLDEYVEEHNIASVENFNDVPDDYVDSELLTYSKIVKDAGIFKGSNNNLMQTRLIKRDQMAEVLVRAFGFEDQEGETEIEDGESSAYASSIEILYENGITNQNPYRPLESTSRAQFATFLVRAYDATVEDPAPDPEPEPEFEVTSVEAVSSTIDVNTDKQFASFTVNDGEEADLEQLADEGYTVEFLSSVSGLFVDKATGELDEEKLSAGDTIRFQVKLTKDGEEVTSEYATLTVEDFEETVASLDDYSLTLLEDGEPGQEVAENKLVLDESAQIGNITGTTKAGAESVDISLDDLEFSSSDTKVVQVNANGEVRTVAPGSATITVTHTSGAELSIPVTVESEAREATTASSETETVGLLNGRSRTISIAVTDQYGMPSADEVTAEAVDEDGNAIGTVELTPVDDQVGQYNLKVTADSDEEVTGEILVKAGERELLSIPLTVGADEEVEERKLELADGETDATLDLSPIAGNQSVELVYNEYNKDGLFIGQSTEIGTKDNSTFAVEASNDNVDVSVEEGVITVAANDSTEPGTTEISITQGDFTLDQMTVEVVDTTPAIDSVTFGENEITATPVALSGLLDVNDIKLSSTDSTEIDLVDGVPTLYVETGTEADGYQEDDVLLGTVDTISSSFDSLTFTEQDGEIYLAGFSAGDEGTFTLRVRDGKDVIALNEVTVTDLQTSATVEFNEVEVTEINPALASLVEIALSTNDEVDMRVAEDGDSVGVYAIGTNDRETQLGSISVTPIEEALSDLAFEVIGENIVISGFETGDEGTFTLTYTAGEQTETGTYDVNIVNQTQDPVSEEGEEGTGNTDGTGEDSTTEAVNTTDSTDTQ